MEALNYLFILDILVAVGLVSSIIFGLIRGMDKMIHRLIVLLIPVLLFLIFLGPITKTISSTKIKISSIPSFIQTEEMTKGLDENGEYSIEEISENFIINQLYKGDEEMEDSKAAELVSRATGAIIKIVTYVLFIIILQFIELILIILFAILRKIFGLKLKRRLNFVGGILGIAKYAVIFVLIYLPIYGSLALVDTIAMDAVEYKEELNMSADTVNTIHTFDQAVNKSIVRSVVIKPATSLFSKDKNISIDAQYFGNALSFKMDDGTEVKFLTEYSNIKEVLPTALKISKMVKTGNGIVKLSDFLPQDIDNLANVFSNSNLLAVALPALAEVAIYNSESAKGLMSAFKTIDWSAELKTLGDAILTIKKHLDVEIDTTNVNSILTSNSMIDLADDLIHGLLKMQLIRKVAVPFGVNTLLDEMAKKEEYQEYNIDYDALKNIDWPGTIDSLVDFVFEAYRAYIDLGLEPGTTDLNVILNNPKVKEAINQILDSLAEKTGPIIDEIVPTLMEILTARLKENEDFKNANIDFDAIKNINWSEEIPLLKNALISVVDAYQELELSTDKFDFKELMENPKFPNALDNVVSALLNTTITKELLVPYAMNTLINMMEANDGFKDFNLDYDKLRSYDYEVEITAIKDTFIEVIKGYQGVHFDKDNWTAILDNPDLETYVNNIVDKALTSNILKNDFLPKLANKIQALIADKEGLDVIKDLLTEDSIENLLRNDVAKIINILKDINNLGMLKGDSTPDYTDSTVQDTLIDLVQSIFTLSIVDGKQGDVFNNLISMTGLNDNLADIGVVIDTTKVTDWDHEINTLCNLIRSVMKLGGDPNALDFSTLFDDELEDEKKNNIINLIECFAESESMGDSIFTMVNNMLAGFDEDYRVVFTDADKLAIKNETGWHKEIETLLDLFKDVKEIDGETDYANLDTDKVTSIINKASESVIASKIVGKVLMNMFGDSIDHDFTTRDGLSSGLSIITNAITISRLANSDALDDPANMSQVTDSIRNMASDENISLVNDFLGDILDDPDANYSKDQINESADLIDEVYSAYEASGDKENFSLDDLPPETLNDIEDNPLAKELLLLWFNEH